MEYSLPPSKLEDQLNNIGFAMTFGILQDDYDQRHALGGSTGVIGTTMNGVMYLSMPVLSTFLERERWIPWRRNIALVGSLLASVSLLASSWSTAVWHLILLQGVLAALGNALVYVPMTLSFDNWFQGGHKATAYGVQYSAKNVVGTGCPFVAHALLVKLGLDNTLRLWAGMTLLAGLFGTTLMPDPPSVRGRRSTGIPWSFLKHQTFYVYGVANVIFSSGYGLAQTYLSPFASQSMHFPVAEASAMLAIFNGPGILSCIGFGLLNDKIHLSSAANTAISALGSALCVFFLWGPASPSAPGCLIAFAIGYGFFASGYSSTWAGWISDLEREAADRREACNGAMLYGWMNGARGIGYLAGGLSGVELLHVGAVVDSRSWAAFGTRYGALILFTGVCSVMGAWSLLWTRRPYRALGRCITERTPLIR